MKIQEESIARGLRTLGKRQGDEGLIGSKCKEHRQMKDSRSIISNQRFPSSLNWLLSEIRFRLEYSLRFQTRLFNLLHSALSINEASNKKERCLKRSNAMKNNEDDSMVEIPLCSREMTLKLENQ
ncbi:hypothetical protein WN51_02616 [Melipona quadrifasciata]|uniref:Uncharacterized protein n=1 Tax=Melipona quadrifasciata TaxID=166423 RepID=A0A0M8ZT27_9HYME|nr:hypothetical protein WN51_02616 [Melipona quadrifasciata]